MSKAYFISFSGSVLDQDTSLVNRQLLLHDSAQKFGNINEDIIWQRGQILNTSFYAQNKEILDQERGAGFWAWKPYIILKTLKKLKKNDWVIYCDIGKPFKRGNKEKAGNFNIGNTLITPVDSIIEYASNQNGFTPGVWIPHYGLAHVWTKRDCFVGMGCDSKRYHNSPHVQAGYSAWSNSNDSIKFLEEWLSWCMNPAIISDNANIYGKPNLQGFRDHRHDQSILSNMSIRDGLKLFGPKEKSLPGYRNFNFILRHMELSQCKKKARKSFGALFKKNTPELPIILEEYLSLQFLTELQELDSILIESYMDLSQWQQSLSTAKIDLFSIKKNTLQNDNPLKDNHYTGIFLPNLESNKLNKNLLGKLYSALKPGGSLVLGKYETNKLESINTTDTRLSFDLLVQWINKNQRLPKDCGKAVDQRKNALTLGNAVNPLHLPVNNGKSAYAVFTKPKMYFGRDSV